MDYLVKECWRTLDSNGKEMPYKAQISSWGNIRLWINNTWKYALMKQNSDGQLYIADNFVLQGYIQGRPLEVLIWCSFRKSRPSEIYFKSAKVANPYSLSNLCAGSCRTKIAIDAKTAGKRFLNSKYYYYNSKYKREGAK